MALYDPPVIWTKKNPPLTDEGIRKNKILLFSRNDPFQHGFHNKKEEMATRAFIEADIETLTVPGMKKLLYKNGIPPKSDYWDGIENDTRKGVYPFITLKINNVSMPYPMWLVAMHRNDLYKTYKQYVATFSDKIKYGVAHETYEAMFSDAVCGGLLGGLVYDAKYNGLGHIACAVNNIDIAKQWDICCYKFDDKNKYGQSAVHVAAMAGNTEIAIEYAGNAWTRFGGCCFLDKEGETPARRAIQYGHVKTALALERSGDNIFYKSQYHPNINDDELLDWLLPYYLTLMNQKITVMNKKKNQEEFESVKKLLRRIYDRHKYTYTRENLRYDYRCLKQDPLPSQLLEQSPKKVVRRNFPFPVEVMKYRAYA